MWEALVQSTCLIKGWYCFYSGEYTKSICAQVTLFDKHSLEEVGAVIISIAVFFLELLWNYAFSLIQEEMNVWCMFYYDFQ